MKSPSKCYVYSQGMYERYGRQSNVWLFICVGLKPVKSKGRTFVQIFCSESKDLPRGKLNDTRIDIHVGAVRKNAEVYFFKKKRKKM